MVPSPYLRFLMRLYPRAYRERYGAEMESFHAQERASGAGGPGFVARLTWDHVRAAGAVRWREGGETMRAILDDLRGGARSVARAPAFAAFAVLTLALGIGATTAVFSVVDRVLLRPLPYPGSERMVLVGSENRLDPGSRGPLSEPMVDLLMQDAGPAEAFSASAIRRAIVRLDEDPERLTVSTVTDGFFTMFGARPALGRLFGASDFGADAPAAVVLSHGMWRDRFGEDPAALGRVVVVDDRPYTVIGVLAADFLRPPEVDVADGLWLPLSPELNREGSGSFYITGIARLRPGGALEDLEAHAARIFREAYPAGDGPSFITGAIARPYQGEVVGDFGGVLARVLAAVGLLLAIACVNVAGLLLTRGARRAHELAVRGALGAGRSRLVRQLLTESGLLALGGALLGSGLAYGTVALFRRHAPPGMPRLAEVTVDARGLAFAVTLGLATVLLFGLWPALRSVRDTGGRLRSRSADGVREGRSRFALIAVETGLAAVLAVASSLLAHDLARMATRDPGFRPEGLVALQLDLRPRYERDEWVQVWEQLLEGARAVPGVGTAAVTTQVPFTGDRMISTFRPQEAEEVAPEGEFIVYVAVGGDYLETLGPRLLEGRAFDVEDDTGEPVVMVNEAFVARYWPGASGVGRTVRSGGEGIDDEPAYRVVGVVSNMTSRPGRPPVPRIFVPHAREQSWAMEIVVRTTGDAGQVAAGLRDVVRAFDPALPVTHLRTVASLGTEALAPARFYAGFFGGFAVVALLLAAVGVYGTTAFVTRTRTREIGIRMALGARREQVVRAIVGRSGSAVGLGVALGLCGAFLGAGVMERMLAEVAPREPAAYVLVAAVVGASALLSAWLPARRAGRIDPGRTLREEV